MEYNGFYTIGAFMKLFVILGLFLIPAMAMGQTKAEISEMLSQMKAQGMFSKEDIAKAQVQLEAMSDKDIGQLKSKAQSKVNDPEIQKRVQELSTK